MLMQNHGLLASINGIVSLAQLYRIPLVMVVSHRGGFGEEHPWQTEGGGVTEHVLDALRIPHTRLESPDHVARRIQKAQTLAYSASRPVANTRPASDGCADVNARQMASLRSPSSSTWQSDIAARFSSVSRRA